MLWESLVGDIKLFKISDGVEELSASWISLERKLQTLIGSNMNSFFGVNFLKAEYVTLNVVVLIL